MFLLLPRDAQRKAKILIFSSEDGPARGGNLDSPEQKSPCLHPSAGRVAPRVSGAVLLPAPPCSFPCPVCPPQGLQKPFQISGLGLSCCYISPFSLVLSLLRHPALGDIQE